MHLYWRIIEELRYLGEFWAIKDPSILRCYKHWVQKHAESIQLNFDQGSMGCVRIPYSLN